MLSLLLSTPLLVQGDDTWLVQAHLHGSLSEGRASMRHHVLEAETRGYDVLWWTDHMERQFVRLYRHHLGFEGSLREQQAQLLWSEVELAVGDLDSFDVGFGSSNPFAGSQYAECLGIADAGTDWSEGRLVYDSAGVMHRKTLLSDPRLRLQVRPVSLTGTGGVFVRVFLSSTSDGVTETGIPNVLEYIPVGMEAAPPEPGVERVALPAIEFGKWNQVELAPLADSGLFVEGEDQALYGFEIVVTGKSGARMEFDLDEFSIELAGPTDLDAFRAQEAVLNARYSSNLTNYVGMEVAGPATQMVQEFSTRDHLVALYPGPIPRTFAFDDPIFRPENYPRSGVTAIHDDGGIAVLCHVFGARWPFAATSNPDARELGKRVLLNRAWNCDAMEIGYPYRERPLEDHVRVWDALSADKVFITGMAVSDNHFVEPWDKRLLRWGSWIQAPTDSAADLIDGILAGEVFFGDPERFDPDGELTFQEAGGAFSMGDVVAQAKGDVDFRVAIDGAVAGDEIVILKSGKDVGSRLFATEQIDTTFTVNAGPGDWVRVEVRDPSGDAYLFSNPIYFVPLSDPVPPGREPGGR